MGIFYFVYKDKFNNRFFVSESEVMTNDFKGVDFFARVIADRTDEEAQNLLPLSVCVNDIVIDTNGNHIKIERIDII